MPKNSEYVVFLGGVFQRKSLGELIRCEKDGVLYSARLSSGIFGSPHCCAGNRGPKGKSEVLFAVGMGGLVRIIELGFLPCPVCRPHRECGFWEEVGGVVQEKYKQENVCLPDDFEKLSFDARRVGWEELVPLVGVPSRLYLPKGGVWKEDILALKERFDHLNIVLPPIGYYDKNAPGRFVEYCLR